MTERVAAPPPDIYLPEDYLPEEIESFSSDDGRNAYGERIVDQSSLICLPEEIENFRSDHGRNAYGELIADQGCLICHEIGDQEPVVATFADSAANCRTCHPSEENPALQGGAPVLNPEDLPPIPKTITHDAPYPGFKETVKGLFRGFVETITRVVAPTETSAGTVRETIRTGASYRLPGRRNSIAARVVGSGLATVDGEGTVTSVPNEGILREAVLGLRSDRVTIEGGLINTKTPLGRQHLAGILTSLRPTTEISADVFAGFPVQTQDPVAMIYGGGVQASRSEANGRLTTGLDLLGSTKEVPHLAFNAGGLFSELKGRVRGAFSNKTYFDPGNVFMPLKRSETAGRLSLGPVNLSGSYMIAPPASDDPFSGKSTVLRQNLEAGVGVKLPHFRFDYGFSKGTYRLDGNRVVVTVNIGPNLDVSLFAEHQRQLFLTEQMATTRFGGDVTMTFRDFQTRVGYLERRGDPFPIFEGLDNQGRWLSLSGSYQIAGVTVSGQMVVDVENKFLPTSGQLVVTIPFAKAPAPGEANERFTTAESTLRSIASRDPILGSFLSSAIYPPQIIPADLTMDHKKMRAAGVWCGKCHTHIKDNGQMANPEEELCVQCHHQGDGVDYDPDRIQMLHAFLNFDHRVHVPEGEVSDETCLRECHSSVASATIATRDDLPAMATCRDCHTESLNTYLVALHNLDNECQICHVSDPVTGKLVTKTPNGLLVPKNHGGRETGTGERDFWREAAHPVVGRSQPVVVKEPGEKCDACHGTPEGGSACDECHGEGAPPPASHLVGDWKKKHPTAWLNGNDSCQMCHHDDPEDYPAATDEMSLCRDCHDKREVFPQLKHTQDWRYDCRDADPTNYHQLNALSGAEFCFACHEPDHHAEQASQAIGCSSCHGAENLGNCNHD